MAEELTQALTKLAERGEPRGARAVLDAASRETVAEATRWWVARPAWVAAAAFVSTMTVFGGSLALGLAIRREPSDVGTGWVTRALDESASGSTLEWLVIPAIALTVAIAALIVRKHLVETRKEYTMATTIDRLATEELGTQDQGTLERTRRNNHWLTGAVIVLALALVAMGAWAIYETSSDPATAATSEVQALYDDYLAAWNNRDASAFRDLTTEDFVQYSFGQAISRSTVVMNFSLISGFKVELVGELVMVADGTNYYVGVAENITFSGREYEGISAYRIVPTPDGLRISEHSFVGNL